MLQNSTQKSGSICREIKIIVFWNMMPSSLVGYYKHSRGSPKRKIAASSKMISLYPNFKHPITRYGYLSNKFYVSM